MNSMLKTLLAAGLGFALAFAPVLAQELRVGAVNVDRIMRDSEPAKAASIKLQQEFAKREKELNDDTANFKTAVQKFDRDAPTLSETLRISLQRKFADQERELQRRKRALEEDFVLRRNEERQSVLDRLIKSIEQVAAAEKYDLIVQEAAYINPRLDITDAVMKRMASGK
jgi:outer membrane protein